MIVKSPTNIIMGANYGSLCTVIFCVCTLKGTSNLMTIICDLKCTTSSFSTNFDKNDRLDTSKTMASSQKYLTCFQNEQQNPLP